jgi:hypothetical protein
MYGGVVKQQGGGLRGASDRAERVKDLRRNFIVAGECTACQMSRYKFLHGFWVEAAHRPIDGASVRRGNPFEATNEASRYVIKRTQKSLSRREIHFGKCDVYIGGE